ncbi:MAG TPA: adenylate/guanylate cyclase domain-containing protein [Jatrophihabitantaceae bacterium]|nr:adenylate/guanylate cyclase domain-containing protein [Jatrophihabitantaceae bacterium]
MTDPDVPARRVVRRGMQAIDKNESLLAFVRRMRKRLPGDEDFGDPLSTARFGHLEVANEQWTELTENRPGVVREIGRGALQVWQSVLEARGHDHGDQQLTVVFTDLVDFSSWSLGAGDDQTLRLLRDVAVAIEPPVKRRGGEVVKRLGDGMMAVFVSPTDAFDALVEANQNLREVKVGKYRPRIRAGMHTGSPRRLGGDYLGIDVNIAARVAQKATAGEILASQTTVALLDPQAVVARKKRSFALVRAKGVPDELEIYAISPS